MHQAGPRQFLAIDPQGEVARIHWLLLLRWVACCGVLAVVLVTGPLLGLLKSSLPLLLLVLLLALLNLAFSLLLHFGRGLLAAGQQVLVDLLILGGLLFFSGGVRNPFSAFLAVQVILGAVLLPRAKAIRLGLLGSSLVLLLLVLEIQGGLPANLTVASALPGSQSGALSLWGSALALIITMGVALFFTINIMDDLRARADQARRSHQEVERERQSLANVVRSVGAGLVVLDPQHQVLWSNTMARDILQDPLEGQEMPLDLRWISRGGLERGDFQRSEWQGPDLEGRLRTYQTSAAPVLGPEGEIQQIILLFMDVTEQRTALQQLQLAEKLAALGRLAAGVAHEIATPLASVAIFTGEARKALEGPLETAERAQVAEFLSDASQEVGRISRLVRRLLDLSHPDLENQQFHDLFSLVQEAVRLLPLREAAQRVHLEQPPKGLSFPLEAGRERILQVLLNVLDNALDASSQGNTPVEVSFHLAPGKLTIAIQDHGCGILPEDLPRVFDPFFTTKEVGQGTGLGLYVSYEIMKNLGGDIQVESKPKRGTLVKLTLPVSPEHN